MSKVIEVELAGIPTVVTVDGDGPPVVLVPGGGARCAGYFPNVSELHGEASVITHERPGADEGSVALSLADQARCLRQVIDAVGRGPAIVVGHSLGGPVTAQLAADHPDVVASVLLLDPTPFTEAKVIRPLPWSTALVAGWERVPVLRGLLHRMLLMSVRKSVPEPIPPEIRLAIDVIVEPDLGRRAGRRLRKFTEGAHALTERLEANPIAVGGITATAERKPSHRFRKGHERISAFLGTRLEVWEGTTHSMHFEQPDRVIASIRALLVEANV